MRKVLPALTLLAALGAWATSAAQEDGRALVARSIQAVGGEDKLAQVAGNHTRLKGVITEVDGAPFTAETFKQLPDKYRYVLRADVNNLTLNILTVANGPKMWTKVNGQDETTTEPTRESLRRSLHVNHVATLLPLLKEDRFTLSALGESVKDGRAVLGVKVVCKGQPDVVLFFDKADHFLVRIEYRSIDDASGQEIDAAVALSDYREFDAAAPEEAVLKAAQVGTGEADLLAYLQKRTLTEATKERLAALVRKLGADGFTEREEATRALIAAGSAAVPFLRQAAQSGDAEVSRRAQECLDKVKGDTETGVTTAVVRLVGLRKPAGAAEALLAFLPGAADEALTREVKFALAAVAVRDGKPDDVLTRALEDKDPVRRAAAAAALGKDDGALAKLPGRRIFIPGLKHSTKVIEYRAGKKSMEWQRLEVLYFNRLDDALFAKP